jgi:crossover junction endodeoxyribonuclease RuvC
MPVFYFFCRCSSQTHPVGISPRDFEKMRARVRGATRVPTALRLAPSPSSSRHQVILGIDPSLRGTGFGIIQCGKPHSRALVHGTINCPAGWERSRCLLQILTTLRTIVAQFKPTVCAIEGLFYAQNLQTALIMGEARGAALVAAADGGLEIFEIAPRKVKQAIVGYGAAQKSAVAKMVKSAVAKMVQRMLQLAEEPAPDAADALALALAFAQETSRFSLAAPKRV